MEPEDFKYTGEEVDLGFLLSIQNILNKFMKGSYNPTELSIFDSVPGIPIMKEEWLYDPTVSKIDENTIDFYHKVYPFLIKEKSKLKDNIFFEDDFMIIRVKTIKDTLLAINQMIQIFIEEEEYEKCAQLQEIVKDLQTT
jgi:hypothetical protein